MRTQCLITGCALIFPRRDPTVYYWGDLHHHGEARAFVFNAVVDERGRAREFDMRDAMHDHTRGLCLPPDIDVYESRGVFVMQDDPALLSVTARAYVAPYFRFAGAGQFVPMNAQRDSAPEEPVAATREMPLFADTKRAGDTSFEPMKTRLMDAEEGPL